MADRFWVGDGGNWSDDDNHWATETGGAAGDGNVPTSSDDVYFDANSFTAGSQTVTIDANGSCKDMDWTGATNTPTLAFGSNSVTLTGDATFIAAMSSSGGTASGKGLVWSGAGVAATLTSNGFTMSGRLNISGSVTSVTLADTYSAAGNIRHTAGLFDTNNQTVTTTGAFEATSCVGTLTFGSSTVTCADWNLSNSSSITFNSDTSTLKITTTGNFHGGSLIYYNVEILTGAITITGSNTFNTLTLKPDTTQTVTFTDGTTQTMATGVFTGSSGKVKTLTGTSTAGWKITKTGGSYVDCDYMTIDYSHATPEDTFYAGANSTNGGNNRGWVWATYATRPRRGGSQYWRWWLLER